MGGVHAGIVLCSFLSTGEANGPTVRYAAIVIERKLKGRFYEQSQGNSAHSAAWRSKKQAGWNCDWGWFMVAVAWGEVVAGGASGE